MQYIIYMKISARAQFENFFPFYLIPHPAGRIPRFTKSRWTFGPVQPGKALLKMFK